MSTLQLALSGATPPEAAQKPHETLKHNATLLDNYFWLRERDSQEVLDYLNQENTYTETVLKPTEDLQKQLYDEMVARIQETDLSVPVKRGPYEYYSRTEKGKQYSIYCRKALAPDAEEEVLLDANALAEGHDYFSLGTYAVSPTHHYLAYSADTSGAEVFTLYIKDLFTGELLEETIENTAPSLEWANDDEHFFYVTLDEARRPYKLSRHQLETAADQDVEIFCEEDERFFLSCDKTKDEHYLLLTLHSKTTSEVWYLSAEDPLSDFQVIEPRRQDHEYFVEHHNGSFLITSNDDASNFKLMQAPVDTPEQSHWQELMPYDPEVKIDGLDVFEQFWVVYIRHKGQTEMMVWNLESGEIEPVAFEETVYTVWPGANPEYTSDTLRFNFSSLMTPHSVYDMKLADGSRTLKKQQEVLGDYDPDQYHSERVFVEAEDGTQIPMSLVHRKGVEPGEKNPTLLYGYGSYGICIDPTFSSARLSLLDRGFIFAIAHVRGGGEMGRPWYEDGKFKTKKNTFGDFIACAEYLVKMGYTCPERLGIMGGSAGGMLMGAVVNQRPDLFGAAIAHVPFVDVVNTMLDASLPLTVTEYEEWGSPEETDFFEYMLSYSPYDNVASKAYPAMLVTGGLNDPRVQYWEPTKWVAKLRALKTDNNPLLLKMHMGAGHGGASGRYDYLKEIALDYAFLIATLGVEV